MRVLTPIIDLVENNRTAASVGLAGILRHPCCIKALGQGIEPCCEELLHASKLSGICGQLRPTRQPGRAVRVRLPTVVQLRVINPRTLTPLYSREKKFMKVSVTANRTTETGPPCSLSAQPARRSFKVARANVEQENAGCACAWAFSAWCAAFFPEWNAAGIPGGDFRLYHLSHLSRAVVPTMGYACANGSGVVEDGPYTRRRKDA
jgi:hypothetical protein